MYRQTKSKHHMRTITLIMAFLLVTQITYTHPTKYDNTLETQYEQVFTDVPPEYEYYNSIAKLQQSGIIQDNPTHEFRPNDDITAKELAIILARADDLNINQDNYQTELQDIIWYKNYLAKYKPEYKPSDQDAILAIFTMTGIQCFTNHFKEFLPTIERGYVTEILCKAIEFQELNIDININYVEGCEFEAQMTLLNLIRYIPGQIIKSFAQNNWSIKIDKGFLELYTQIKNRETPVVGLTKFKEKCIYISQPIAIVHEFGHYWHDVILDRSKISNILYQIEQDAAKEFMREYTTKNALEFTADIFSYYTKKTKTHQNG